MWEVTENAHTAAVLLAEQRMMPRFRLAHIWLIGGVADDRIWLHRSAALPAALTDGFKGAFTVAGVLCAAGAALTLLLLPRKTGCRERTGRDDGPPGAGTGQRLQSEGPRLGRYQQPGLQPAAMQQK
jgi:hypothetical protein